MTESQLRSKVANWLVPYIGISEGSSKHKAILSVFNNSKLCTRYSMTTRDAWCATAVSAAFISCGLAGASGSGKVFQCVECSCNNMIAKAKTQGIWVENDAYTPKVGDVIMYDWQDSGVGDNKGSADHVGIVYSISGSTMKIIEGNKNDSVGFRTMFVNGRYIRGYITPHYSKAATSAEKADTKTDSTKTDSKFKSYKVKVTANVLNIRAGAGTNYDKTGSIKNKGTYTIVAEADGTGASKWGKLKSGKGWISLDYCKKV